MTKQQQIERVLGFITSIDTMVATGAADTYRICTSEDPMDPTARFWGLAPDGNQRFGDARTLLIMVDFPSEKLAKRCLDMTGGYVVSTAKILELQRAKMVTVLNKLRGKNEDS